MPDETQEELKAYITKQHTKIQNMRNALDRIISVRYRHIDDRAKWELACEIAEKALTK